MIERVCENIEQLFKVQPDDESRNFELEGLSYAFGLLLTHSGNNTRLTLSTEVPQIQQKVFCALIFLKAMIVLFAG